MFNKKFFVLFIYLFVGRVVSVNYQESFLQANEYYKEGKFKDAEKLYEGIPNKGAAVNYNLGNCSYKQGKPGLALVYWRRAESQWGMWNRSELLHNISLIENQGVLGEKGFFASFAKVKIKTLSFIRSVPILLVQILFLLVWLFLFIYLRILYRKGHTFIIVFLFLLVALLGVVLAMRYSLEYRRRGIIINDKVEVRSGPDNKFSVLEDAPEALEVAIKKESSGYYKVKFHGRIGWIKREDIIEV